jgi:tetratricopeptide (TPR) repeat protein
MRPTRTPPLAACLLVAALLAACTGCPNAQPSRPPGTSGSTPVQPRQDHFKLALEYLQRLDEFDPQKGMIQTTYHLNRWINDDHGAIDWREDPLIDQLPGRLRAIGPLRELGKREFTTEDVRFLREASWARSISRWVTQQPGALGIDPWLDDVEKAKGEAHAYELSVAMRLFDWTVRNIQLSPLLPYPAKAAGPADESGGADESAPSPLERATPGPGYITFPWQTLLYGNGDAWQRTRVFILLCRQQEIDVVMLAFDDLRSSPRPRPWLPAALIDDQLYLFDTELGLPIPGAGGVGIATLAEVRADKGLLRSLDVGSANRYTAADADFERLVVLIDAAPEALSYRLRAVDAAASTQEPLMVAVAPGELADRLRRCEGISRVELWQAPMETWIYRGALERRAQEDPQLMRQLVLEDLMFGSLHPLVQGRVQQFRGNFEKTDDNPGAKGYYLAARLPDAIIAQIETSQEVQAELGIIRGRENDQQWQVRLQLQKEIAIRIKQTATYWLGLVHYETGRYETAVDWLGRRTLEANEANAWKNGARYNLSRVREALGELDAARKLLLLDDSPQKHGNLLRARFLRQKIEQAGDG